MSWLEALTEWRMWAAGILLGSVVYAILKIKVPVGERARRTAAMGAALARRTGDEKFARAGLQAAHAAWRRRKYALLAISAVAGVLAAGVGFILAPGLAGYPGWLYGAAVAVAIGVVLASKY